MSNEVPAPSFVPKKDRLSSVRSREIAVVRTINILFSISLIIFFLSVIGAVLSYLYSQYTESTLQAQKQRLEQAKEEYDPETVELLTRFDTRLQSVRQLLNNHIMMTPVFAELSKYTTTAVSLENFDSTVTQAGGLKVTGKGVASSYEALAVQSDTFAKSSYIVNPIFTNLTRDEEGVVNFDYSVEFRPELLRNPTAI
jgi:uncharacterized protein YlxW (UPF0749 family)